ncbi:MAG: 3-deoxy-7-phosphoheptulonate synthase [Phycisphaerae bacterium]|nr:3-deoxy-7-phosphoheptulonate synthase [Phycisphaerae bacterium]
MLVVMDPRSTTEHLDHVVKLLRRMGADSFVLDSAHQKIVEVLPGNGEINRAALESAPMIDRVLDRVEPLLAANRQPGDQTIAVPLGTSGSVGGRKLGIIAGPCSVESESQLLEIAAAVKEAGAVALRGGAFKPRTSPYAFQGHGERGLEMLARAREETGLAIVTEVMRCEHVELVARYADVLQVGSRSMHNTHLLAAVGQQSKPVLLKRGWCGTLEEFLLAAEYIMAGGNRQVILCERGIRTHETYVRNTLSLAIVPEIKRLSTLPIIVDPSHGTGRRHLVAPMSNAAVACGADGLLIEAHPDPSRAWSDGHQSLDLEQFHELMKGLRPFAEACGREV